MEFEELWQVVLDKNLHLQSGRTLRMSSHQFERALRMAYDIGKRARHEAGSNTQFSMFDQVFGGKT